MGPYGLKTLRMVAGVVVDGIDPIQRARVGEDCNCASSPDKPPLLLVDLAEGIAGEEGPGLVGPPLAGATGALSALPKPIRTACPFAMPMLPPKRLRTSSLARIASA